VHVASFSLPAERLWTRGVLEFVRQMYYGV